jgi:hypothetical protein
MLYRVSSPSGRQIGSRYIGLNIPPRGLRLGPRCPRASRPPSPKPRSPRSVREAMHGYMLFQVERARFAIQSRLLHRHTLCLQNWRVEASCIVVACNMLVCTAALLRKLCTPSCHHAVYDQASYMHAWWHDGVHSCLSKVHMVMLHANTMHDASTRQFCKHNVCRCSRPD